MQLTIARRFCGPPESGNGGYVCGALAQHVGGAVEITLRAPPPLETALSIEKNDLGVTLRHGDALVAEAKPASLTLDVPAAVSFAEAVAAARHYRGAHNHPYPTCFVCGPARAAGDALRLEPGAVVGRDIVATPWIPTADQVASDDRALPEIAWASLDCPGYFAMDAFTDNERPKWLLGRMTGEITTRPKRGERCVVIGWLLQREGRKAHTATALFGEDGSVYGRARGIWIELR